MDLQNRHRYAPNFVKIHIYCYFLRNDAIKKSLKVTECINL